MDIEDVLSSRVRIKILKFLARLGELNVSDIGRRLGINYQTTSKNLKILEDEGILLHKRFGRIRLYRINENSSKAKAVLGLLETWEKAEAEKKT